MHLTPRAKNFKLLQQLTAGKLKTEQQVERCVDPTV